MTLTRWLIIGLTGGILLIDTYLAVRYGRQSTISVVMTNWGRQYPVIPFAWGFLMGHFWAQDTD